MQNQIIIIDTTLKSVLIQFNVVAYGNKWVMSRPRIFMVLKLINYP